MIRVKKQLGFSLIELIVSLAVFSIVMTISIGALLVLVSTNDQLQGEQSVMTNLSFALDSMTREIRTGTGYFCMSIPGVLGDVWGQPWNFFNDSNDVDLIDTWDEFPVLERDCSGRLHDYVGLAIFESGNSVTGTTNDRISYFYDNRDGKIYRRIGTETRQSIVADSIYIHEFDFWVTGSNPLSEGELTQPTVTIFIEASEDENTPADERYRLQTTVTQRTLDL